MYSKNPLTDRFAESREEYKPDRVRLLWIAESPPAHDHSFFYFDQTTGSDHLFRETMRAVGLWPNHLPMKKGMNKHGFLRNFRTRGYYLVDTCPYPVNKLPEKERRRMLEKHLPALASTVSTLDPKQIIVVKSNVYPLVLPTLSSIGFSERILNRQSLPFPSHGWQKAYRTTVRKLLKRAGLS